MGLTIVISFPVSWIAPELCYTFAEFTVGLNMFAERPNTDFCNDFLFVLSMVGSLAAGLMVWVNHKTKKGVYN